MRQFLAPLCLALGVSPALAHNARPAIGLDLAAASYVTDLGTALPATPQCVTRVSGVDENGSEQALAATSDGRTTCTPAACPIST